jgi:cutinase
MTFIDSGISRLAAAIATAASCAALAFSSLIAAPTAGAAPCPDVQVVFARGTFEAPGVGGTGQAFVDALHRQLGDKSIDVYAVNYPASLDFPRAADGIIDASNKLRDTAANCPNTKSVLGGFSQGAAVAAYITADSVPANFVLPPGITGPLPTDVADHVAAVTLFGKPSNGFLNSVQSTAPPLAIGHLYSNKTIDLCIEQDPICSQNGGDAGTHSLYATNGMADQAAMFVTQRVQTQR